jgi:hypothetical protein
MDAIADKTPFAVSAVSIGGCDILAARAKTALQGRTDFIRDQRLGGDFRSKGSTDIGNLVWE